MRPQTVSCVISGIWRDAAGLLPATHFSACSRVLMGCTGAITLVLLGPDGETPISEAELTDPEAIAFFTSFVTLGETLATKALVR